MQITFDHSRDETEHIKTFYFKTEQPLSYTAGQFVELTLKHHGHDTRGEKRWFTLSSSPIQDMIAITTKFAIEQSSTYKQALLKLQLGTILNVSEPMGDFVLPKLIQTPLIFIAGGIGVTPFHSMLQYLADTGEERPIQMLLGVQTESEIVFQQTYDAAKQHVTVVVSQASPAWGGERGQLTAELIMGLTQPTSDSLLYISGPEPLVETLTKDLKKAGLSHHQIIGDYFPNYPAV